MELEYHKNFKIFSMKLEHYGKLEFSKLKYLKNDKSLYIFEKVVD